MITPELLEYVRTEIAKGKTREEIHGALISGGGWSESDLSEAFRIVIPMQRPAAEVEESKAGPSSSTPPAISGMGTAIPAAGTPPSTVSFSSSSLRPFSPPPSYSPSLSLLKSTVPVPKLPGVEPEGPASNSSTSASRRWQNLVFVILGLLCVVSWYFYRPQIISFWNKGVESSQELSVNSWNSYSNFFQKISFPTLAFPSFNLSFLNKNKNVAAPAPVENNTIAPKGVVPPVIQVKDCGTMSTTLKLGVSSTYENNPVLACLGMSAINCENAKGILKDDFFPTIFEITNLQDSCNFKLSYGADSALTDITGKKLAGQYISCPINIVKAIDNTKPATPRFIASDKTDLSKYGSQIYFYGTLGLFIENNLNQNKVQSIGCSGDYIQSMIASYNLSQKN